jgi:nitrate/TMAO reductase-like tetraheme cytochrome c subunit
MSAIVMLVMPPLSIELTSTASFCNSCHLMNSYYDSWKTSTHKDVQCVSCHIPPGTTNYMWAKLNGLGQVVDDILHRTSTKPSASVSDFSCTRSGCHDINKVRTISRKDGKFFFNHSKHLDLEYNGIDLHCTSCHSHVKGDKHFEVNPQICINCHLITPGAAEPSIRLAVLEANGHGKLTHTTTQPAMAATGPVSEVSTQPAAADVPVLAKDWTPLPPPKPGEKTPPTQCKYCHDAPKTPLDYRGLKINHNEYLSYGAACESCHRGVTAKPDKMDSDRCLSCHEFGMERMKSIAENHRIHLSTESNHKVECFSCHGVIRHGPAAQFMQVTQMECNSCHSRQHMIQQDAYQSESHMVALPTDGSAVSPMFMVHVDCTGCHVKQRPLSGKPENGAVVMAADAAACDRCHKAGLGQTMVPLWQKSTRSMYDAALKMLPPASQTPVSPQVEQLVKDAKRLLEIVRLDGSWGVHNPRYTQKLIEESRLKLLEAKDLSQPKASAAP